MATLLADNTPLQLSMTVRRGDTMLWNLDFAGVDGAPLTPEHVQDYMDSTWKWEVRGKKADGALIGEITVTPVTMPDGTFRLECYLPPETSAALLTDPRINVSDLQRTYMRGGYKMVDTIAEMPITATADTTRPSIGGI